MRRNPGLINRSLSAGIHPSHLQKCLSEPGSSPAALSRPGGKCPRGSCLWPRWGPCPWGCSTGLDTAAPCKGLLWAVTIPPQPCRPHSIYLIYSLSLTLCSKAFQHGLDHVRVSVFTAWLGLFMGLMLSTWEDAFLGCCHGAQHGLGFDVSQWIVCIRESGRLYFHLSVYLGIKLSNCHQLFFFFFIWYFTVVCHSQQNNWTDNFSSEMKWK